MSRDFYGHFKNSSSKQRWNRVRQLASPEAMAGYFSFCIAGDIDKALEEIKKHNVPYMVSSHLGDSTCVLHGDHYHICIQGPLIQNSSGATTTNPSDSQLYKRLQRQVTKVNAKKLDGQIRYFIAYMLRKPRVLMEKTDHFNEIIEEAESINRAKEKEAKDNRSDTTSDGGNKFEKQTKRSQIMEKFVSHYRESKCREAGQFKKYCIKREGLWNFVWINFISKGMKEFSEAVDIANELLRTETLEWSYKDHLDSLPELPPNLYHSQYNSQIFLAKWCDEQGIDIWQLAENIVDHGDMRRPKKNSLVFHGESNAGKTLVAMSIYEAYIARGVVTNNGSSQFLWQDCLDDRFILNEECVIAETQTEEYKNIMAGAPCMVNIKCKPAREMNRTPILFTCNALPWCMLREPKTYENRCIVYRDLRTLPWLKDWNKRIHPGAWSYYVNPYYMKLEQDQVNKEIEFSPQKCKLPPIPQRYAQSVRAILSSNDGYTTPPRVMEYDERGVQIIPHPESPIQHEGHETHSQDSLDEIDDEILNTLPLSEHEGCSPLSADLHDEPEIQSSPKKSSKKRLKYVSRESDNSPSKQQRI